MAAPFPTPYPALLGDDPTLGSALGTALTEALESGPAERPLRTAISIAAIHGAAPPFEFAHAGYRHRETCYSATLLEVAAMYAAYELRRSARAVAATVSSPSELFARLHEFDQPINNAVPLIAQQPALRGVRLRPDYERVFAPVPLPGRRVACDFSAGFVANLRSMVINSNNNAAATCVQALGYSWINGALHAGGFFSPPAQSGIWLAGTFIGALPPVTIPSCNDERVAQATTCLDMANLYAHMFGGTLVDAASSNEMLTILMTTASVGNEPSYMDFTRRVLSPRSFSVTHSKTGLGRLKTREFVASDAAIVEHESGHKFVVVWQNNFEDKDSLEAICSIVERTIELYVKGI